MIKLLGIVSVEVTGLSCHKMSWNSGYIQSYIEIVYIAITFIRVVERDLNFSRTQVLKWHSPTHYPVIYMGLMCRTNMKQDLSANYIRPASLGVQLFSAAGLNSTLICSMSSLLDQSSGFQKFGKALGWRVFFDVVLVPKVLWKATALMRWMATDNSC